MKKLLCSSLAQVGFIHDVKDERNTHKFFPLTTMFNMDVGFATFVKDLEWKIFEIGLDHWIIELASN